MFSTVADATADGRSAMDVGANGETTAAGPADRDRSGGSDTRSEPTNNENRF